MHEIQYQTVHFTLNGKPVEKTVDVRASLTDLLRNDFKMYSVKKGCEVGECGACNVLIDDEAINSCLGLNLRALSTDFSSLSRSFVLFLMSLRALSSLVVSPRNSIVIPLMFPAIYLPFNRRTH